MVTFNFISLQPLLAFLQPLGLKFCNYVHIPDVGIEGSPHNGILRPVLQSE